MNNVERVLQQSRETPGRRPLDEYRDLADASTWQLAREWMEQDRVRVLRRIGRRLMGLVNNLGVEVVVDRDGRYLTSACGYGDTQPCSHALVLLILWAEDAARFSVQAVSRTWESVRWCFPTRKESCLHRLLSPDAARDELATALEMGFRMNDLRNMARFLGVGRGGTRKADIIQRLMTQVADRTQMQALVDRLTPDERLALTVSFLWVLHWADPPLHSPYLYPLVRALRPPLYALFSPQTPWDTAVQVLERVPFGVLAPNQRGLPVLSWAFLLRYLPLPVEGMEGAQSGGESPIVSSSAVAFLRLLYRTLYELQQGEWHTARVALPKHAKPQARQMLPLIWHPEKETIQVFSPWVPIGVQVPHMDREEVDRLSQCLDATPEATLVALTVLERLGLTGAPGKDNTWQVNRKAVQEFLLMPAWKQWRLAALAFWDAGAGMATHMAVERGNYRLVMRNTWHFIPVVPYDTLFLLLGALVALLPKGIWVPWSRLVALLKPWQEPDQMFKEFAFHTDPPADWPAFVEDMMRTQLQLLVHLGGVEVRGREGQVEAVRITYCHEGLVALEEPLDLGQEDLEPEAIQAYARRHSVVLQVPWQAVSRAGTLLSTLADSSALRQEGVTYTLSATRLREAFQRGETPEEWRTRWEETLAVPMPDALWEWLQSWYEEFGQVRVYPDVVIIECTDEATRRQVEVILSRKPDTRWFAISPRLLLVAGEDARLVRARLEVEGHVPRYVKVTTPLSE